MVGIPSVVVGPGDIDQAHKPDEWILLTELEKCNAFISRLIDECRA
jgi:acetylornithine deacetylase